MNTFAIFVPVQFFFENDLVLVELLPHECGQVVTGVRGPNSGDLTIIYHVGLTTGYLLFKAGITFFN